jgi:TusA-related sulfurtransferase
VIGDASNAVGFLDAPGLDPDALTTAINAAADALAAGSVLTVYNDHPSGPRAIEALCERGELTLIATIGHPTGGTTFTLRTQQ